MGHAAYMRGSQAIAEGIQRDYWECTGRAKDTRGRLERAETQIERLEQFCRDAQALIVDARDPDTATGLLKAEIRHNLNKRRGAKSRARLEEECTLAHNAWVDSDRRETFVHIQACYRKAKAWKALLDFANELYVLPFDVPNHV